MAQTVNVIGTRTSPQSYASLDAAYAASATARIVWAKVGSNVFRIANGGRVIVRIG